MSLSKELWVKANDINFLLTCGRKKALYVAVRDIGYPRGWPISETGLKGWTLLVPTNLTEWKYD